MVGRPHADPEQKQDFGDRTVTQGIDIQRSITEALQLRSIFGLERGAQNPNLAM